MADALNPAEDARLNDDELPVHQMLHGYADGHRLLANSLTLSTESTRTLLRLSDISGSNLIGGFEEYLTAYPLEKDAKFAFAKTWSAPEMARPGCVWTHTLILTEAVVARLHSLNELMQLFSRPSEESRDAYAGALSWRPTSAPRPAEKSHEVPRPECEMALWKLFGPRGEPVVLEAVDSRQWEQLFMSIWALAWPSLRMNLSLTTGSLSARKIGRRLLDMQAAPAFALRDINREIGLAPSSAPPLAGTRDFPDWVHIAARELNACSPLAIFLRKAAGASDGREQLAPLAGLFSALNNEDHDNIVPSLIAAAAKHFPSSADGSHLKVALFGPPSLRSLTSGIDEDVILEELAATPHHPAFSGADLSLHMRGRELWQGQPNEARRLLHRLFRVSLNSLGEEILRSLISGLRSEDAIELAESEFDLLAAAVRVHPSLAKFSGLWQRSESKQRALLAAVATAKEQLSPELAESIVGALLEAGAENLAKAAFEVFGEPGIASALNWIDLHRERVPTGWEGALAKHPRTICNWLTVRDPVSVETILFVSTLLDPKDPEVVGCGTAKWLYLVAGMKDRVSDSQMLKFQAFLLTLALENPKPHGERLAAFAFAAVHAGVEDDRLDYDSWQALERQLPDVSWSLWWDKCERLRRGLIQAFVRYSWPVVELLKCAPDSILLKAVKKSARKVEGGRELIARLVTEQRQSRSGTIR